MITDNFLSKLIDWKEFEKFVASIYEDSENVIVKHNVTEIGKSESPRQIDVLVLQQTKLHTVKYVIECKRWKAPVDRDVVDKMVATVEDVGADKGAIFTTKGYEDGALKYAKQKNIDLFLVRDLLDSEWSELGRKFTIFTQGFHSKIDTFNFENAKIAFPNGSSVPENFKLDFSVTFESNQTFPERLNLYPLGETRFSVNYVKLLIDLRNELLREAMEDFNQLVSHSDKPAEIYFLRKVILNFGNYLYRHFKYGNGFITFDTISFSLHQLVTQDTIDVDLASKVDFALVVENYITSQRNVASKLTGENKTKLSKPIMTEIKGGENNPTSNVRMIKYSTEHYVDFKVKSQTIPNLLPDLTIDLQTKGTQK